ncbi:MAG: transposase, partial [Candidatus Aenigmatarchaeota archaeon]
MDEEKGREKLEKLNKWILETLFSSEELTIAIDFTTIPYYGEENPMLVSDSRLPGTNIGIKFAVLSVVEKGKTITLKARQVSPFESEVSVLGELLDYAEDLVNPKLVLLDRGFYSVEAIRELKSRKMGFIMPAKKTNPVREICKEFKKGEAPAEADYTVSSAKEEEEVRLLLTEKETENGKEIHPFITNLDIDPEEASENYSWRWRIETNIRELEKFKPFTTSQSMELRRLYFLISMTLYNLWILTRNGDERPRAHEFKDWLEIELIAIKILK